jgi:murein DD-endopeptidase MepM/ murein hydrolase activator NlpD
MKISRKYYRTRESRQGIPKKKVILFALPLIVAGGVWLWLVKFESEKPAVQLLKDTQYIESELGFRAEDGKSGLAEIHVEAVQYQEAFSIFQEKYPKKTAFVEKQLPMRPLPSGLKEGEVVLRITARDHSWNGGNKTVLEKSMAIDVRPPRPAIMGGPHYINQGGSGLIVVAANEEMPVVGLEVDDDFFKGFPVTESRQVVYFALRRGADINKTMSLVAEDRAGNRAQLSFRPNVRARSFRQDRINITDGFLAQIVPYFKGNDPSLEGTDLEIFISMNKEQRKKDADRIRAICKDTESQPLWSGAFLRMSGKTTASFGDRRTYFYQGREIDRQTHLGIDLASLTQSPVPAANRGKVVFVDAMGIYGNSVMLDHGCGLFSMYAHLSLIDVEAGTVVEKGGILGRTGSSGMAGGDHLHFAMIVQGVFVDPVEWWDPHWIQDNIELKLK